MQILLIARTLLSAQYILGELCVENADQIVQRSARRLLFKDGSSIYTTSLNTLKKDIRLHHFDQILVERGVSHEIVDYAWWHISSRTYVPRDFIVQMLDE